MEKKEIPESFPENVLKIREGYDAKSGLSKYVMHENYRKTDSDELYYFLTRLLPCVNTKYTNYKNRKCCEKRLGEVFTTNDEAFALALLINELDSYNFLIAKKNNEITSDTIKKKKPFTSSASGNKVGWNNHGLKTLESMEREIKHRREEEVSKILEDKILEDCVTKAGGKANRRNKRNEFENAEYSFEATFEQNPALLKYCTETKIKKNGGWV